MTDAKRPKLSETQKALLRRAGRNTGRGWCHLNVEGSGEFAAAKALGRKGLLACIHPGGPAWGEWNLTPEGRAEAYRLLKEAQS